MTIARTYRMQAHEGRTVELIAACAAITAALADIDGFRGADLLRDVEQPCRFVFIERWASVEAHKAGGTALPKALLSPLMAALTERPEARYLEYLDA